MAPRRCRKWLFPPTALNFMFKELLVDSAIRETKQEKLENDFITKQGATLNMCTLHIHVPTMTHVDKSITSCDLLSGEMSDDRCGGSKQDEKVYVLFLLSLVTQNAADKRAVEGKHHVQQIISACIWLTIWPTEVCCAISKKSSCNIEEEVNSRHQSGLRSMSRSKTQLLVHYTTRSCRIEEFQLRSFQTAMDLPETKNRFSLRFVWSD